MKRMEKTPLKRSPGKGMIVLRSSPRKRLQLSDTPPKELLESRRVCLVHGGVEREESSYCFCNYLKVGFLELGKILKKCQWLSLNAFFKFS